MHHTDAKFIFFVRNFISYKLSANECKWLKGVHLSHWVFLSLNVYTWLKLSAKEWNWVQLSANKCKWVQFCKLSAIANELSWAQLSAN